MTCVPPCLHQDYCAFYGCPFKREPQSSSQTQRSLYDNQNGNDGQGQDRRLSGGGDRCLLLSNRLYPGSRMPACGRQGCSARCQMDRYSAPRTGRHASNFTRQRRNAGLRHGGANSVNLPSGVGPGHHQPRSTVQSKLSRQGRARDRAIGPVDSRNILVGTPLIARDHATGFIGRGDKLRPLATIRTPRTKPTPAELIACQDGTTARGINFISGPISDRLRSSARRSSDVGRAPSAGGTAAIMSRAHRLCEDGIKVAHISKNDEAAPAGRVATEARHLSLANAVECRQGQGPNLCVDPASRHGSGRTDALYHFGERDGESPCDSGALNSNPRRGYMALGLAPAWAHRPLRLAHNPGNATYSGVTAGETAPNFHANFNSNGGRTRLRPVSTERACESTARPASRGGKRAVQSIRIFGGVLDSLSFKQGEGDRMVTCGSYAAEFKFSSGGNARISRGAKRPVLVGGLAVGNRQPDQGNGQSREIILNSGWPRGCHTDIEYVISAITSATRFSSRGGVEGHARRKIANSVVMPTERASFGGAPGVGDAREIAPRQAAGIKPGPRETQFSSDGRDVAAAGDRIAARRETGERTKAETLRAQPVRFNSRGPRFVMTSRGETPAALEAATDRVRRPDIGPLAQGYFPARLLPREAFLIRRRAFLPLIPRCEGEPRVSAASRAAEALHGAA